MYKRQSLSIPGQRIGYIAFRPDIKEQEKLLEALSFSMRVLGFVNANALMQKVVADILDVKVDVGYYKRLRDKIYKTLVKASYDVPYPEGAFYVFPKYPCKEQDFIEKAMSKNVLVTPGSSFGCNTNFRIAYCTDPYTIENGLERLAEIAEDF